MHRFNPFFLLAIQPRHHPRANCLLCTHFCMRTRVMNCFHALSEVKHAQYSTEPFTQWDPKTTTHKLRSRLNGCSNSVYPTKHFKDVNAASRADSPGTTLLSHLVCDQLGQVPSQLLTNCLSPCPAIFLPFTTLKRSESWLQGLQRNKSKEGIISMISTSIVKNDLPHH